MAYKKKGKNPGITIDGQTVKTQKEARWHVEVWTPWGYKMRVGLHGLTLLAMAVGGIVFLGTSNSAEILEVEDEVRLIGRPR